MFASTLKLVPAALLVLACHAPAAFAQSALGAAELLHAKAVASFREARFSIGRIVITGVFEGVESDIAQRHRASLEWFLQAAQCLWRSIPGVGRCDSSYAAQETLQVPLPGGQLALVNSTHDVTCDGPLSPLQHQFKIR